jgi:glycerol kinase
MHDDWRVPNVYEAFGVIDLTRSTFHNPDGLFVFEILTGGAHPYYVDLSLGTLMGLNQTMTRKGICIRDAAPTEIP